MDEQNLDSLISSAFDLGPAPDGGQPGQVPASEPATPEPAPSSPPAAPQDIELSDDHWVSFHDGKQKVRKLWKEIKQTQFLLPGDYTRKTQALAADRKAHQSEREQFESARAEFEQLRKQFDTERAQLVANLRDKNKIEAIWLALDAAERGGTGRPGELPAQTQPAQPQTPPLDPQALIQQVQSYVQQVLAERDQAAAQQAWATQGGQEIRSHVDSLVTAHPKLKTLDDASGYLLYKLDSMIEPGRTTLEEAKSMLSTIAESISQSLGGMVAEVKKSDAVKQAQLKDGIEPPGGAPTAPATKSYDPRRGLDDEELERDIIAEMKAKLGLG